MHLSTGGSPQWLYELIKVSSLENEVFVAEFNSYGSYAVQKNKIIDLVGKKNFKSLGYYQSLNWNEEKLDLLKVVEEFKPDIIHFNEIPENFEYNGFPEELLNELYKENRDYKIFETCHDNSFDFNKKVHQPDAYVCVSDYHHLKTAKAFPETKSYVWDYVLSSKERPDRDSALKDLGLDPGRKHVLNVGLFHDNKNQKYIYDLASKLLDVAGLSIEFHFVGNECYKDDCGIENTDLPNCTVWGERDDVDRFYSCMDLFLFPSKRELNPLCVKEALSWGMPVIMNKIESCDLYKKYKDNPSVKFIQDINIEDELLGKNTQKQPSRKKDLRFGIYTSFYNTGWNADSVYKDLCSQTHKNWKWFITDDFSQDDTKEKLLKIASEDDRVVFCEQQSKREMYWNSQKFISEDCDYVVLCDSDDGLYPKALSLYNHLLNKNPDVFSFAFWLHQYANDITDPKNITNSDFSWVEGDWFSFLSDFENDLKNNGIDWTKQRSFRHFGALRGYKNLKNIQDVELKNMDKSIYEDSIRALHLQRYGSFIMFPRPFYKYKHDNKKSESKSPNQEIHSISKSNYLNYLAENQSYKNNKIINKYGDYINELSALNLSSLHHETERKNISLITNKIISQEDKQSIQDLYFDHDLYINKYNGVDYYFLFLNSFSDTELFKIFDNFENQKESFEVNGYFLLDEPDKIDKYVDRLKRVSRGKSFTWNVFCRSLTIKFDYQRKEKENVLIELGSSSLGDSLAWVPYVEEYRKKHNCKVDFFSYKNDLYRDSYPEINFIDDLEDIRDKRFDKILKVGWYNDTPKWIKQAEEQRAASHYLGLEHKEIRPKVDIKNKNRVIDGKYVCIATQSTLQCKYWNNPEGWNKVVEYLNSEGYKVVCIDKYPRFGIEGSMNDIPSGAINKTGDFDLQERITDLYHCDFFIGLGSGLSWLAWALEKPVVLISGFSNEQTEFYTPYRVINKEVCNSCWNREDFDASNWNWCPDHEGTERKFECSKQISFDMVKEQIDKLI